MGNTRNRVGRNAPDSRGQVGKKNVSRRGRSKKPQATSDQILVSELQDSLVQTLFSANLIADVLPRLWEQNPKEGQARLNELRQLTRLAMAEARSLLDVTGMPASSLVNEAWNQPNFPAGVS